MNPACYLLGKVVVVVTRTIRLVVVDIGTVVVVDVRVVVVVGVVVMSDAVLVVVVVFTSSTGAMAVVGGATLAGRVKSWRIPPFTSSELAETTTTRSAVIVVTNARRIFIAVPVV